VFNWLTIGSMILLTILILIQTRGASIGQGIGGTADINLTRRGTDKTIFQITIICAVVFAASLILTIFS